jgi:hypothetical protein
MSFDIPAWAYGIGGLAGIAAFFFILRGNKICAIAVAVVGVLALWRGSVSKAKAEGRRIAEERQREKNAELAARLEQARRSQAELNQANGGKINEADPNLRD